MQLNINEIDVNETSHIKKFFLTCSTLLLGGLFSSLFSSSANFLINFLIPGLTLLPHSTQSTINAVVDLIGLIFFLLVFKSRTTLFYSVVLMISSIDILIGLIVELSPSLMFDVVPIIFAVWWFYLYKTKKPWIYFYAIFGLFIFLTVFSFLSIALLGGLNSLR